MILFKKILLLSSLFRDYADFKNQIKTLDPKSHIFLFFPRCTVGGAERVHLDILKAIKDEHPICFIEELSEKTGFFSEYNQQATLVSVAKVRRGMGRRLGVRLVASIINARPNAVVFGCDSRFFYKLIPFLEKHVYVIDLFHSFSDQGKGAENWSLPQVSRINQRVVLGNHTKNQFEELYTQNNVPLGLLNRIRIISNAVAVPDQFPEKSIGQPLEIIYVGRKGYEKRLHIFNAIAAKCFEYQANASFSIVGDMFSSVGGVGTIAWHPSIKLYGEIIDAAQLNKIYKKADLLLITSYREGFPMVIMEGMAHGVVPISTNVGELRWYITEEDKNGVLISAIDEQEIVEAFADQIKAFEADRDLLKICSSNAYLYAKTYFSEKKFEQNYRNLFLGRGV